MGVAGASGSSKLRLRWILNGLHESDREKRRCDIRLECLREGETGLSEVRGAKDCWKLHAGYDSDSGKPPTLLPYLAPRRWGLYHTKI